MYRGVIDQCLQSRPLQCAEIRERDLSLRIASKLARIHELDVPIAKDPDYVCEATERCVRGVEVGRADQHTRAPKRAISKRRSRVT